MTAWPLVPLGEILERRKDEIEVQEHLEYARLTIRMNGKGIDLRGRVLGSEIGTKRQFIAKAGQLVLSKIDARNGAFGILPSHCDQAIITGNFWAFDISDLRLDPKYFEHFTKTSDFLEFCIRASEGTTNRRYLQEPHFLRFCMPLPPIEEQRRIADRIEQVTRRISDLEHLVDESSKLFLSLVPSFTGAAFHIRRWPTVSIEELVGRANLKNGISLKSDGVDSDIRCLRLSAIRNGNIDCSDSKPVPLTIDRASPYLIRSGDVFIVRGNGSKELVGQAGMVKGHIAGTIFPDLFIRVPLDSVRMLPTFFVAWWNSPMMREKIEAAAKTTSGIWKINQGHIASFPIPVPPVSDQLTALREIENHVSRVTGLQRLRVASRTELHAVLPSLLNRAFSGQF
jgi:type I restriction enzyme S subunit